MGELGSTSRLLLSLGLMNDFLWTQGPGFWELARAMEVDCGHRHNLAGGCGGGDARAGHGVGHFRCLSWLSALRGRKIPHGSGFRSWISEGQTPSAISKV